MLSDGQDRLGAASFTGKVDFESMSPSAWISFQIQIRIDIATLDNNMKADFCVLATLKDFDFFVVKIKVAACGAFQFSTEALLVRFELKFHLMSPVCVRIDSSMR